MSSDPRLDALYDALKPRIDALEPLRREARWRKARFYLLMAVPGALLLSSPFIGSLLPDGDGTRLVQLGTVGLVAGIWIAVYFFNEPAMASYAEYLARFKRDVVAQVFKAVCPTATYGGRDRSARRRQSLRCVRMAATRAVR